MVTDIAAAIDGWSDRRSCVKQLVNTEQTDETESIVSALASNPALDIVGMDEQQIFHLKEDRCNAVSLRHGQLPCPNGGVSFSIDPSIEDGETIVAIFVKFKIKLPPEMQWNQGGHLLGVYGTYCNNFSSSARAPSAFECRWRWDARGKLSVYTRRMNDDPNEWQSKTDTKIVLERDVWYELFLAVHVDGKVAAAVDGALVHDSTCSIGLEELSGVKFSVMCLDNSDVEDKYIFIKDVAMSADIDSRPA